jgi:hypothetical protein
MLEKRWRSPMKANIDWGSQPQYSATLFTPNRCFVTKNAETKLMSHNAASTAAALCQSLEITCNLPIVLLMWMAYSTAPASNP